MLRSTKLLPLCKGAARNWIVAGTVYGPKPTTDGSNTDDNNNNNNSRRDETQAHEGRNYSRKTFSRAQEYSKNPRPHHHHHHQQQQQAAAAENEIHHPQPSEAIKSYAAVRDAALRQSGFRARASGSYPEEGLASVGRFSAYTEDSKEASSSEPASTSPAPETKASSSSSSTSSSPEVNPGACSEDPRSSRVEELKSDSSAAEAPVFGDLPSFRKFKCELEKADSTSFDESLTESKLSTLDSRASTTHSSEAPRGNQEGVAHSNSNRHLESSSTSQKKPQGRHPQRNNNNRNSNSESHKVVARVCNILNQHGWGDDAVKALNGLHTNLNAYQVNEILKQQRDSGLAYSFFLWARKQAGYKHDVHTYTTMLGILGRAKNFEVLNGLLGEMIGEGCEPNVVTYNRLIHCYGRANDLESSLKLFNVMKVVGCEPDRVTYCTLIDLQAKAGFHDSAMELYGRMQQAGFRPDTFTYSIIIHCLGKAGKLNAAYKLFCEMTDRGFAPSLVTYNIIIDLHAKAGKFDMALKLYGDLQEVGYTPDRVTYGIIMEVLGNCGHIEDAEQVFDQMMRAGWVADNPIFGLMVDMWGKTGNAEKAAEWFNRMLDSGLQPNVPACNSLLSAYLRACFYDAAEQVLRSMVKWGLLPTLQTYTSLLSSCSASRVQWEYDLIFALMNSTGHPAHPFLCSLLGSSSEAFAIRRFFEAMQFEELESRRGFADSLMDFLHKAGKGHAAGRVWEVATEKNLYPYAVREKAPSYWSINLHVMSMGTALVVLSKTLASLRELMMKTGAAPSRIDIITGWGRRSRVPGASLVKQAVEEMLRSLNSPFYLDGANFGCFVGQGPALLDWLKKPQLEQQVLQFA